jgi:AcrR family transcriptional regulator
VIRRKGLDRTGIRDIADELGSTPSVVTHYFRNRDGLIRFACAEVFASYRAQLYDRAGEATGFERLERLLLGGLPVEPGREVGWEVWIAFLGHAIGRPEAVAEEGERQSGLRRVVLAELARLRDEGLVAADCDIAFEADLLNALVDGLGVGRVFQPEVYDPARVAKLLRGHLEQRFGCRPNVGAAGNLESVP